MDDAPATPQPRRRRWRRWAFAALFLLAAAAWLILPEPPEVKLAQGVKFGMSESQVEEIVGGGGESGLSYSASDGTGLVRGATRTRWYYFLGAIERKTGLALFRGDFDSWPVHIHFDKNLRVDRIKRGIEILERPAATDSPGVTSSYSPPNPRWVTRPD